MKRRLHIFALSLLPFLVSADPKLLDDQFELPPGFHIYRAATAELSGGSYALTFDGEGRLLVGDGNAIRRLNDKDHDGVYDSFEVIASNLGWRGPQCILVYGDKLFAVGGDGLQLYEGYNSEGRAPQVPNNSAVPGSLSKNVKSSSSLIHKGRLGPKLLTGNDHEAHQIIRGHDGFIYLVFGNGAEATNRVATCSPICWEKIRLIGLYKFPQNFSAFIDLLENETDHVTQFHIAQTLAKIEGGWTPEEETRLLNSSSHNNAVGSPNSPAKASSSRTFERPCSTTSASIIVKPCSAT